MKSRTSNMWFVGLVIALVLLIVIATQASAASTPASAGRLPATRTVSKPGINATLAVQYKLRSMGYSLAVDGVYGPQTTGVVRAWQKANGLVVDGIAGTQTRRSLGLTEASPAIVKAPTVKPAPAPAPAVEPAPPAPAGDVESIIRDVWPADLADWAVRIATRESNLRPGVHNPCCWGLFQLNWSAHHAWLSQFGANSASDLLDPRINATAAFALFQQAGVHPWDCNGQCTDIPL